MSDINSVSPDSIRKKAADLYRPEYAQDLIEHFSKDFVREEIQERTTRQGTKFNNIIKIANTIPTISSYISFITNKYSLKKLSITPDIVEGWCYYSQEFNYNMRLTKSYLIDYIKTLMASCLIYPSAVKQLQDLCQLHGITTGSSKAQVPSNSNVQVYIPKQTNISNTKDLAKDKDRIAS